VFGTDTDQVLAEGAETLTAALAQQ
jgi:hypothetical protein